MQKLLFGRVRGKEIFTYYLENDFLKVGIINYGAVIRSLQIKKNDQPLTDVVMGFDDLGDYIDQKYYFGCVIGRCANRISDAAFSLNGIAYHLEKNEGNNHLHGGSHGFWNQIWSEKEYGDHFIELSYVSEDGEEGYPGTMNVMVRYTLSGRKLSVRYSAVSDQDTVVNLTNHSYFNLTGDFSKTIENHIVYINADQFTEIDSECKSTGRILDVGNTVFDLRKETCIFENLRSDEEQMKLGSGYNHNFIINHKGSQVELAAYVKDPVSGRQMNVYTDRPGVHFYTGNYLNGIQGKQGNHYIRYGGLCFETQYYPDAVHFEQFPEPWLKAGDLFRTETVFEFL